MVTSTYTTRVLEASEGMYITQAAEVDTKDRAFYKKMYLAVSDSPENYTEISEEEAAPIIAEQERLQKAEQESKAEQQ